MTVSPTGDVAGGGSSALGRRRGRRRLRPRVIEDDPPLRLALLLLGAPLALGGVRTLGRRVRIRHLGRRARDRGGCPVRAGLRGGLRATTRREERSGEADDDRTEDG